MENKLKFNIRDVVALETYIKSNSKSVYARFDEIGKQFHVNSKRGRQIFEKAVLKLYEMERSK